MTDEPRRKCAGTNAKGEPCGAWPEKGSDLCPAHNGKLGGDTTQYTKAKKQETITPTNRDEAEEFLVQVFAGNRPKATPSQVAAAKAILDLPRSAGDQGPMSYMLRALRSEERMAIYNNPGPPLNDLAEVIDFVIAYRTRSATTVEGED